MAKIIEILVGPGGAETEIKTEGFSGESCKDASAAFEKIIGGRTVSDEPTDEMYRHGENWQQQTQRQ